MTSFFEIQNALPQEIRPVGSPYVFWGKAALWGVAALISGFLSQNSEIFSLCCFSTGAGLLGCAAMGVLIIALLKCKDSEGQTYLHRLIQKDGDHISDKCRRTLNRLIKWHLCDLETRNDTGQTLFHFAYTHEHGKKYIAHDLLRQGADVNAQDDLGRTALAIIGKANDKNSIKKMVAFGAYCDDPVVVFDSDKRVYPKVLMPLSVSSYFWRNILLLNTILIISGLGLNFIGQVPEITALTWGMSLTSTLTSLVALITLTILQRQDKKGQTKLHRMIEKGERNQLRELLYLGLVPNLEVQNNDQETLFAFAVKCHKWDIARDLLRAGACANPQGQKNNTPLHESVIRKDKVALGFLLKEGKGNQYAKNRNGLTAEGLVIKSSNAELAEVFADNSYMY